MERLCDKHQQLEEHFGSNLFDLGEGPPCRFLIDHELDKQELASLRELVQNGLRSHSLTSFSWQTAFLPLLICAVEVGYEYEGNGTDFWPRLCDALGREFAAEDREQISWWFAHTSSKYRTVAPGESQWEQAFRHIAWPIMHAVAAKDIRRPFADCLRRFSRDVKDDLLEDEVIVSDLSQISTPVGSRRFRTWLGRPAVVAGIVRDLLGGKQLDEAGLFSKHFRDRLIGDLRSEPEIRRAVRQVEIQRVMKPKSESGKKDVETQTDFRFGSFFLSQDEHGGLELCGELPELPKSVQRSLKSVRRRWKVRPWGLPGASPIPADCLRSRRGHFQVSFSSVARAESDSPFFTGIDDLTVDAEAKRWLASVRFPTAGMLAFPQMQVGDDSSHSISGRTPHRGKIWVLSRRGDIAAKRSDLNDSYCREIGQVDGGEIHELEAENPVVREWLGWPETASTTKKDSAEFLWLRPSPIPIDSADRPMYTTDDEVGISVFGDQPMTLVLRQGSREIARESVSEVATVAIESKGNYTLTVLRGDEEIKSLTFGIVDDRGDGFIEPEPENPIRVIVSHVDTGETELSRSDLFNHRLVLDVVAERGIDNLFATITLSPGESMASVHLDRVPTRLPSNHRVWEDLIQALPESVLKSPCDISLHVEIEGFSPSTWQLEAEVQHLWWEENDSALPIPVSDSGVFDLRYYCVVTNRLLDKPNEGDPFLAVALDRAGNELHSDAKIGLLGDSTLHRALVPPDRFLRQMDDEGAYRGLRSIAQRYLQFSSASSTSLTAEINRVGAKNQVKLWVLHCLCGPNWFHKQKEMHRLESTHPVAVWWECQSARDDLLLPKSEEKRSLPDTLPALLLAEFSEVLPDQWWDGSVVEFGADDASLFDSLYQYLINDHSVYVDADALHQSVIQANELLCGATLADLIIPVSGGDKLLAWRISDMNLSELATDLHSWIRQHLGRGRGRQQWTRDELSLYLKFLLYPEWLRKEPWEAVLEKLLHDRCVARAGAFVAWRVEQNARLDSMVVSAETTY